MMTNENVNDARANLDMASALADRTRRAGQRWMRIYLSIWAAASVGLVLLIGLGGKVGVIVGIAAWTAIVVGMVTWARRQGAIVPGANRTIGRAAAGWGVVYAVVLAVGLGGPVPDAWFWIVGALATAVPLAASAVVCGRCATPAGDA